MEEKGLRDLINGMNLDTLKHDGDLPHKIMMFGVPAIGKYNGIDQLGPKFLRAQGSERGKGNPLDQLTQKEREHISQIAMAQSGKIKIPIMGKTTSG